MNIALIGSGMMGGAIALHAARHGLAVQIYDARPDSIVRLKERAAKVYARWVKNGQLTQEDADAALGRLVPATLEELGAAEVIVEAVFENLAVKREVLAALEPHLGSQAIVATNTSALRVADVAAGFAFAERVLGLHYFSPAEVCALVELVRAETTSEATVAKALAFLAATHRTPLLCADAPGFAINRFFCPYYNEAARIVADGLASPAEVDELARARLGVAAGPFTVLNLIGPRVAGHAMANLAPLGPFYAVSPDLIAQGEADLPYEFDGTGAMPAQADLIEDRLLAAIAIPALELLAEGVADAREVDHGATVALRFKQGPFALMRSYPPARLEAAVAATCARHHHPIPSRAIAAAI